MHLIMWRGQGPARSSFSEVSMSCRVRNFENIQPQGQYRCLYNAPEHRVSRNVLCQTFVTQHEKGLCEVDRVATFAAKAAWEHNMHFACCQSSSKMHIQTCEGF